MLLACGDIPGGKTDRLAAWFFLTCVYMRARYSDGLNLTGLFIDCPEPRKEPLYGFIEGTVGRTKTAYTTERKTMNLPMVACRRGVTGKDWASGGLALRGAIGIPMEEGFPLLPAPTRAGWQRSPLSAGQAGMWLRGLLVGLGESPDDLKKVGTHSCKATCLSWLAKNQVPLEDRRTLGYHSNPGDRTTLVYSRDSMAGPLVHLQQTLDDISSEAFRPDHTRSGYRAPAPGPTAADTSSDSEPEESGVQGFIRRMAEDHESEAESIDESESSSEDSQDEEFDEDDLPLAVEAENEIIPPWNHLDDDVRLDVFRMKLVRHRLSTMYHLVADEGGTHLKCGRLITTNFDLVDEEPKFVYPMCSNCFGRR